MWDTTKRCSARARGLRVAERGNATESVAQYRALHTRALDLSHMGWCCLCLLSSSPLEPGQARKYWQGKPPATTLALVYYQVENGFDLLQPDMASRRPATARARDLRPPPAHNPHRPQHLQHRCTRPCRAHSHGTCRAPALRTRDGPCSAHARACHGTRRTVPEPAVALAVATAGHLCHGARPTTVRPSVSLVAYTVPAAVLPSPAVPVAGARG